MNTIIVEFPEDLLKFKEEIKKDDFLIFPLFDMEKHQLLSYPNLILAKPLHSPTLFVLPYNHVECINIQEKFEFTFDKKCFVYDKKYFNIPNSLDLDSSLYVNKIKYTTELSKSQVDFKTFPIYKILNIAERDINILNTFCSNFKDESSLAFKFLNEITLGVLVNLEKNKLKVDKNIFVEKLGNESLVSEDGFIHTQYNCFTVTGRPSNSFGGVNYAALKKNDGSRESFISRFENGKLVMLDYDSYHLRLISKLINYDLPNESVHTYFAKQYFKTDDVTNEMYEESKKISFKMLYGNVLDEYRHVDFFNKIEKFIDDLWDKYKTIGYIESVYSKIKIYADSKTKLFNYLIQNYETEQNMIVLKRIFSISEKYKSVPALYTYDSILFDVHPNEVEYIDKIRETMEIAGKFPTKMSVGKNMIFGK